MGGVLGHEQVALDHNDAEIVRSVIARLEDTVATFGRSDVTEALLLIVDDTTAREVRREIERLATVVLGDAEILRLLAPLPGEPPASLIRADGMAAIERHGGPRFTTKTTLLNEAIVLEIAERGSWRRRNADCRHRTWPIDPWG